MGAVRAPGCMACEAKTLAQAEAHVLKRKLVGGRRHLALSDHAAAGLQAEVLHGEVLGADAFAQAAQAAGVDQLVGLVHPHHDGRVVVDLTGVLARVSAEAFEVGTDLDALQALALQAAAGLGDGLLSRIAGVGVGRLYLWQRQDPFEAGEEPGAAGAVLFAAGGERHLLEEAVDRSGGPAAFGRLPHRGRTQRARPAAGVYTRPAGGLQHGVYDDPPGIVPFDVPVPARDRLQTEKNSVVPRNALFKKLGRIHIDVQLHCNVEGGQPLQFLLQCRLRQTLAG